jgi:alpha-D-ribose 1-methylphosphonate 5-triphosphate synthase subunit PhnL
VLLLDTLTASLDADNREAVIRPVEGARARGAAILGIFHDADAGDQLATRAVDVGPVAPARLA